MLVTAAVREEVPVGKKKLMILGAGRDQVPIIEKAQRMGFETIVVSIAGNYPGFSVANKVYEIDVCDKEEILRVAIQEKICGIITDQLDISVPSVAYVAEKMDLPGIGYDCALRFTNKHQMRTYCRNVGIPVPKFFKVSSLQEARQRAQQIGFPLIIKPVDNAGSRGISKINDLFELEMKFKRAMSYSACKRVILEKFVQAKEVDVEGFVSDFRHTNLVIGDRLYFDVPKLFVPKQTLFPSLLKRELQNKILSMNTRLIEGFRPRFGITHSEWLFNEDTGEIYLGETAIRGGGVFIPSDLIPLTCGIDVNELLIRLATGTEQTRIYFDKPYNKASGYVCFLLPEGTICRMDGVDKVRSVPGVHKVFLNNLKLGTQTKPLMDKSSRCGPILVAGEGRAALNQTIQKIQETLVIEVQTATGIAGIIW